MTKSFAKAALLIFVLIPCMLKADELNIAVASNFAPAMKAILDRYKNINARNSSLNISLSFASTGKHYAQILNGAPFHLFFAADEQRPKLLEQHGRAVVKSRFTYAIGRLVLWSPKYKVLKGEVLRRNQFDYLAMANERLAPFGLAAKQFLQHRDLWKPLQKRIVRGENISQTFQFVQSGNAQFALLAYSQIKNLQGDYWLIPSTAYSPIRQQAIIIRDGDESRNFMRYVRSDKALKIIEEYGYYIPHD